MGEVVHTTPNPKLAKRSFWAIFAIGLAASIFIPERTAAEQAFGFLLSFTLAFICFWWVIEDSKAAGVKLTRAFKAGIALMAIVFVPIYLFRAYGFGKALLAICKFLFTLLCVLILFVMVFSALAMMGIFAPLPN